MRLSFAAVVFACSLSLSMTLQTAENQVLDIVLPTDNDALFSGSGPEFYQYVERNYKGVTSTPWEGGQYGFVRDPTDTAGGVLYTRFHEGIDIRPVHRDANGDPLDSSTAGMARTTTVCTDISARSRCSLAKQSDADSESQSWVTLERA